MIKGALISGCGKYRYKLERRWSMNLPPLACVLHNPSTADADRDDATVRRLVGFATRWQYGGIEVYNLYAYRATVVQDLLKCDNPVGPFNNLVLRNLKNRPVFCGWGHTFLTHEQPHAHQVRDMLAHNGCTLFCLGMTKTGHPRHPVRLPYAMLTEVYSHALSA